MKRFLALFAAFVLAAAAGVSAAPPFAVTTKDTKPGNGVVAPQRTVFDCAGRDTVTLVPFLVDTLRGDTSDGSSILDHYGCVLWTETYPEHIYRLEVAQDLELWAGLVDRDPEMDHDLFLLDGCDSDACLVGANTELTAVLPVGTYYLVVDGYYGVADTSANVGPYTVALETRALGLPAEACTEAQGQPEVCSSGGLLSLEGSLTGRPNLLQAYACNASQTRAGEAWYALDLLPGQSFTARTTSVADRLDLVLWLFADCGPEATCLAAGDDSLAGQLERLTWDNPDTALVTVYLGVDAVSAPTTVEEGNWALEISCGTDVPVEPSGFGDLKALFR